jgi:hypothetical protein
VEAASRQWYPEYLAFLNEPGATDEERVARNLVGHVASRMLFEAPRVRELENEYRQMFRAKAGVAGRV